MHQLYLDSGAPASEGELLRRLQRNLDLLEAGRPDHRCVTVRPAPTLCGLGAVSAFGDGRAALAAGLAEGAHPIRAVRRPGLEDFADHVAGLVPGEEPADDEARALRYATTAAAEALSQSRLAPGARLGLVLGTSQLSDTGMHWLAERLGEALGLTGPRITVSPPSSDLLGGLE